VGGGSAGEEEGETGAGCTAICPLGKRSVRAPSGDCACIAVSGGGVEGPKVVVGVDFGGEGERVKKKQREAGEG
jgi:hypothetical protein